MVRAPLISSANISIGCRTNVKRHLVGRNRLAFRDDGGLGRGVKLVGYHVIHRKQQANVLLLGFG